MIELKNIVKSFGANDVLKEVSLEIREGRILALLGENGAGKSTLMNILGGVLKADSGQILLDGQELYFEEPKDSMAMGIRFIHQELNLINDLPVYENMFLGHEIKNKFGILDKKQMFEKTSDFFKKMEIEIDPKIMVSKLDTSYKQIVEILRALMYDCKFIIMDEPTSSLTEPEIVRVFQLMRNLKEKGVGIVFISHKLNEVMQICDDFVVLRNGNLVAKGLISDTNPGDIALAMVGHGVRTEKLQVEKELGPEVVKIEDLTLEPFYRNFSFSGKSGEIIGVTGLLGDGRSQVFQSIFGYLPKFTGSIQIEGKEIKVNGVKDAMKNGIAYLPNNRKENGIIPDMNILENATVTIWESTSKHFSIDYNRLHQTFDGLKKQLNIKMEKPSDLITKLSGGNQQKVVLSKWLSINPKLLVLDNPTQGVDVGSKEEIYDACLELAKRGVCVVILSNEAQEIVRICDKVIVMYHGEIKGNLYGDMINEQNIMKLATGASLN